MHKTSFGDKKYVRHKHKSHFVFVLHKHKFSFGNAPLELHTNQALPYGVCVCVLTRPPEEKDHWPIPPIKAAWHSSFSP